MEKFTFKLKTFQRKWGEVYSYDIFSETGILVARVNGGHFDATAKDLHMRSFDSDGDVYYTSINRSDYKLPFHLSEKEEKALQVLLEKNEPALLFSYYGCDKKFASYDEAKLHAVENKNKRAQIVESTTYLPLL